VDRPRPAATSSATTRDRARPCRDVFAARPADADRKTLAAYFLASGANPAVLFRMLDGKPYDDLIWKAIKPGPSTPYQAPRSF
jgi:hypothetical protein